MKRSGFQFLFFAVVLSCSIYSYDFSKADSILNANLSRLFNDKLVCMVMHDDSLVYYYHQGADSLSVAEIASATKTMSAALMLRLVQEKVINLDDSIAKYYPFASALGKGSMTLRQLFAHTSGLSGDTKYNSNSRITLQASADSILRRDSLQFTPIGTKFSYTGEDQQVAGAAAELAAGKSWNDLFAEKIATPLGLDSTTFTLSSARNPRIAGGISSNARDMLRFGRFIQNHGRNLDGTQIVDSVLMEEFWKDQTNHAIQENSPYPFHPANNNPFDEDTIYYGLGCWLDIYNPEHQYVEQMSADGAFGAIIWVNRCSNTVGVFMAFPPTLCARTNPIQFKVMDIFRETFASPCYFSTAVNETPKPKQNFGISFNPALQRIYLNSESAIQRISVFNLAGRKVRSITLMEGVRWVSLAGLPNGVLVIRAEDAIGQTVLTGRVVQTGH